MDEERGVARTCSFWGGGFFEAKGVETRAGSAMLFIDMSYRPYRWCFGGKDLTSGCNVAIKGMESSEDWGNAIIKSLKCRLHVRNSQILIAFSLLLFQKFTRNMSNLPSIPTVLITVCSASTFGSGPDIGSISTLLGCLGITSFYSQS